MDGRPAAAACTAAAHVCPAAERRAPAALRLLLPVLAMLLLLFAALGRADRPGRVKGRGEEWQQLRHQRRQLQQLQLELSQTQHHHRPGKTPAEQAWQQAQAVSQERAFVSASAQPQPEPPSCTPPDVQPDKLIAAANGECETHTDICIDLGVFVFMDKKYGYGKGQQ